MDYYKSHLFWVSLPPWYKILHIYVYLLLCMQKLDQFFNLINISAKI